MSMSWALFASANPFGSPIEGANMRGLAKRAVTIPLAIRPPTFDFFVNQLNANSQISAQVIGPNFKIIMPTLSGKAYSSLRLNIALTRPVANAVVNPTTFNMNSYCSVVNSGAYSICIVPLTAIAGTQCGATDYFMVR